MQTAAPVRLVIMSRKLSCPSSPKAESIALSSVSTETAAEARLIALAAENSGLLYFLYLTTFTMAIVSEVKVNAASAIVVIK